MNSNRHPLSQARALKVATIFMCLSSIAVWGFILPSTFVNRPIILSARNRHSGHHYKNENETFTIATATLAAQSLEDSSVEYEQALAQASILNSNVDSVQNGQLIKLNKMDSILCACEEEEDSKQQYDDLVTDLFASLVEKIRGYNPDAVEGIDLSPFHDDSSLTIDDFATTKLTSSGALLLRAYQYAEAAHRGQCRKSGEPYITHPLSVAHVVADLKLDTASLITALLHDTVEDTPVTLNNITTTFSSEISHLVDGVTKVGKVPFLSAAANQSENYRKLILAMSEDIRVVLVKLADRTHNMRTLQYMSAEKQKRIARETMEIYAPIAHRLGIHWLKTELEDECFKYLNTGKYELVKGQVREKSAERKVYEREVVKTLETQMREAGLGGEGKTLLVSGRTKGLYSIYTKMKRQGIEFDDVFDKVGFRIILDDVTSCYQALGIVHSHWKPAGTGKIKDYIALPKANGYRSLHTTVIGPAGKRIEIQIRTLEMHEIAESGIAAHWMYKQNNRGKNGKHDASQFTWMRELLAEVQRQNDPVEFIDSVKEDLFTKEVFAFSPKGELYALALGSSVLDFAYMVHSDLGNHCGGAKVNGKIVTLKHQIQNGDTVEILKSHHQTPRREWLRFVRTSKAKTRITAWLKRRQKEKSMVEGKAIIEHELKKRSAEERKQYNKKLPHALSCLKMHDEKELHAAVGYRRVPVESVMKALFGSQYDPTQGDRRVKDDTFALESVENQIASSSSRTLAPRASNTGIVVGKERNILLTFCRSCRPLFGELIEGVITKGNGIKVHRQGCKHLLEADPSRVIKVDWDHESTAVTLRSVQFEVICEDTPGVLARICNAISSVNFSIGSLSMKKVSHGRGLARLEVLLRSADDLEKVMTKKIVSYQSNEAEAN